MKAEDGRVLSHAEVLLDHLLRLWQEGEPLQPSCVLCTDIQRRIDALYPKVHTDAR
jgi:hypothetical protein